MPFTEIHKEDDMGSKSSTTDKQVKSRERVTEHGEVFTAEREVNAMLDLVKEETERIESRFLEPACGNGNFLIEILRRKLAVVSKRYTNSQAEWERYAILSVSSIYGVELLEDNVHECRKRLFEFFDETYTSLYSGSCKSECRRAVRYLLTLNILWGDALDYTNPLTKSPLVFAEWAMLELNKNVYFQRRDYRFQFLVEKTHQFELFNDEGQAADIDRPVRDDYPLISIYQLGNDEQLQP
jgi:hypothetical protein